MSDALLVWCLLSWAVVLGALALCVWDYFDDQDPFLF